MPLSNQEKQEIKDSVQAGIEPVNVKIDYITKDIESIKKKLDNGHFVRVSSCDEVKKHVMEKIDINGKRISNNKALIIKILLALAGAGGLAGTGYGLAEVFKKPAEKVVDNTEKK